MEAEVNSTRWRQARQSERESEAMRPLEMPMRSLPLSITLPAVNATAIRQEIIDEFLWTWSHYKELALGFDELEPLSGTPNNYMNMMLMMVESLDTLYLMSELDEFSEAARYIEKNLDFDKAMTFSFFEITIRILGGLLSSASLSGRPGLLAKAIDIGERLYRGIDAASGFPCRQINLSTSSCSKDCIVNLAEVGTFQLEFFALSDLTGDPKFKDAARRAYLQIRKAGGNDNLLPFMNILNVEEPKGAGGEASMGGGADS
ncbi:unnamed protein product [Vitrella brassicaformis CCMP3155]|uniref:alpha-1,2-Mannosidase n=1 Tax=Vitrella brassicaformis (strain CCMP3155) TaxID=1169540 RepID=A0A0G4GK18_VITBC|nr:unnamed protein product [Vitrella brassicaformis CCMP3155]|eukprot:CEM30273.1 unnamed protein product [Vitrella brassicaformis CCMP3155]